MQFPDPLKPRRKWLPELEPAVLERYAAGEFGKLIAASLGVAPSSVCRLLRERGVLRSRREVGLIGLVLGVPGNRVYRLLRARGVRRSRTIHMARPSHAATQCNKTYIDLQCKLLLYGRKPILISLAILVVIGQARGILNEEGVHIDRGRTVAPAGAGMNDSVSDILWYNASTGASQIWVMDSHKIAGRATVLAENGSAIFVGPPWSIVGTGKFNREPFPVDSVSGAIGERYSQLGGAFSWLGRPISDELPFPQDGRVREFQNGAIYWWSDIGPRELNDVAVHYTGVHCFGETDVDGATAEDEPYATIGIAGPDGTSGTFRSQIYEDVDAGEGRFEVIEIYRGKPRGLLINTILQEHSGDDTETSRAAMSEAVEKGGAALAAAATAIPVVGPVLGPAASVALQLVKKDLIDALNSFLEKTLGFADRLLGTDLTELTPKQMVVLATRPEGHAQFNEIPWRFETPLLERFGASYKVYFSIFPA